jgi:hypothetical protein
VGLNFVWAKEFLYGWGIDGGAAGEGLGRGGENGRDGWGMIGMKRRLGGGRGAGSVGEEMGGGEWTTQ